MSDSESNSILKINEAVTERDVDGLRGLILANEFVLISVSDGTEDEENMGALTAELGDFDVLVAFTTEANAGAFVGEMDELFEDNEEVEGVVVEGNSMLEYLPDGYGLLLDPETDSACVIEPGLAAEVNEDADPV
ncbi:MAG: hypothetical protein AB8B91_02865 [Rubripirellula sp.]